MTVDIDAMLEAGLYDPASPDADERLRLLEFLAGEGCSVEEMVDADRRGRLFGLAGDRVLRPGPQRSSLADVAGELGVALPVVTRLWAALGLGCPDPDAPVASPDDVAILPVCLAAGRRYGESVMFQLARCYGMAMERVAFAEMDATRVVDDEISLSLSGDAVVTARAWSRAVGTMPDIARLLDVLHRHHLERARRHFEGSGSDDLASRRLIRMAIGFVDLCDFTSFSQTIGADELAGLLRDLEEKAYAIVDSQGGRIVKFIGDAAMISAPRPEQLAGIMATIVHGGSDEHGIAVRAGVSYGEMLAVGGDYYGAGVNLAARLAAQADPRTVVAAPAFAERLGEGWERRALIPRTLRGFSEPVTAYEIRPFAPAGA